MNDKTKLSKVVSESFTRLHDSFYRRGKSYYFAGRDQHGTRIRISLGRDKRVAEAKYHKVLGEIAENKFLSVKRVRKIKFDELADLYLKQYAMVEKKSWKSNDVFNIRNLNEHFGHMVTNSIKRNDVRNYREKRQREVGPYTVNHELSCLRKIFNWAIFDGVDKSGHPLFEGQNPAARFDRVPEPKRRKYLSKGQLIRILSVANENLKKFILIAVNTGMRKGEIRGMTQKNVNLSESYVYLPKTKNGDDRHVPINEVVKSILREGYNFDYNPRKAFETALVKSGVLADLEGDFHFHDLRHTFATFMINLGVPLHTLSKILGHRVERRYEMTDRYAHLFMEEQLAAVRKLDVYLSDVVENPTLVTNWSQSQISSARLKTNDSVTPYLILR